MTKSTKYIEIENTYTINNRPLQIKIKDKQQIMPYSMFQKIRNTYMFFAWIDFTFSQEYVGKYFDSAVDREVARLILEDTPVMINV